MQLKNCYVKNSFLVYYKFLRFSFFSDNFLWVQFITKVSFFKSALKYRSLDTHIKILH
jgi:hypothetical protein